MSVGWFLRLMELIYATASPSEEVLEILNRFNISSFITFVPLSSWTEIHAIAHNFHMLSNLVIPN